MSRRKQQQGRNKAARGLVPLAIRVRPLTPAALSVASLMLSTTALAQSSETLPTIEVQAEDGSGSYQAVTPTISRLPIPVRDIPQTINVVTQQVIQDQRLTTMEDALRTVPGITISAGEGAQQGDAPIIRGFVARGDLFRDGIRDPGWYTRDLFNADRVEVYKGPSAFLFGRGSTGGAINTVTKLPNGSTFVESNSSVTTGPGVREELDAGSKTGNVAARIAALYTGIETPDRDHVWTRRWGVAPSVAVDINDRTKLWAYYIYQGEEGAPDYGVTYLPQPFYSPITGLLVNPGYLGNGAPVTPLPVPRNNWYGVPTGPLRDITTTETHIGTVRLDHELENGIKFTNVARYIANDRFSLPTAVRSVGDADNRIFANGSTPGLASFGYPIELMTVGRERRERETDNTFLINQTDLVAKYDAGFMQHTFMTGMEVWRETRDQNRLDICDPLNVLCRTNMVVVDPFPSPVGGPPVLFKPITTVSTDFGAYVTDQVKITKYFEFLGSLRFDKFQTVYNDPNQVLPINRHLESNDDMFSYRFGMVGHPTENSSLYVAYGNSYNPSAELGTLTNVSVANLQPEQTISLEGGFKIDVLNNKLSLSGAIFHIEKLNLRIVDPNDTTTTRLDGVATVDGLEVGVNGRVTDKWNVFAGYSHLQSRISNDPNKNENGRELPNAPEHSFTFWNTYDVTPELTVGGGATYQSFGWANITNTSYVPEFWKFDAMLSYKVTPKATLQLNVYNITDEFYYSQYFGGNAVPASGRWAALSLRMRL